MTQTQQTAPQLSIWQRTGEGLIYTKLAPQAVMRTGMMSLPEVGECHLDGVHSYAQFRGTAEKSIELVVRCKATREIVAKLVMSGKQGLKRRDAEIRPTKGSPLKAKLAAVITAQDGPKGAYLRVYVPTCADKRAGGANRAYGVVAG